MCGIGPTVRRRGFPSLILLLSLLGASTSPLWAQAAARDVGVGTDRFFTTSDGVKLHYIDAGKGRPIVFIPGGMMPAAYWEPQIREFSKDYRTIALDHRGRGLSEDGLRGAGYEFPRMAADIHELIKHVGESDVVLVGSSMGMMMALTYVERFGTDRLGGLVLMDGLVWEPTPVRLERCIGWANGIKTMESDRRGWSERAVRGMFVQTPPDAEFVTRMTKAYLRTSTSVAAWFGLVSFCSPAGADKREALTKLARASTPVMAVVASPPLRPQADTVKGRIPGARVEVFDGVGHAVSADAPDRFNRVLREFLRGSSSRAQN